MRSTPDSQRRFESECVALFASSVQVFGIPRSVGQIYGILFASAVPLSFSDIVERLAISKGSASQGLQWLRSLGAIKPAPRPAEASLRLPNGAPVREYYMPELGLRKLVSGVLRDQVTPLAAAGPKRLAQLRTLAQQAGGDGEFYLERVRQLESWRRKLKTVLPVLSALLGPRNKS